MSPQVMNLSRDGRLLFIGLILQADDEGRGSADPRKLKAAIFAGDDDLMTPKIVELQAEIEAQRLALFYDGGGDGRLYELPSFVDHQYIQRPKKSAYPSPSRVNGKNHSRSGISAISDGDQLSIGGSIGSEGSDQTDLTHGRASGPRSVDNSARPARASDRFKNDADRKEQMAENRRKAERMAADVARAKS